MIPISPKELSEREFSKTIRGYTPAEVDEYIDRLTESYQLIYRENVELARQLGEALNMISVLNEEKQLSKQTLQAAKQMGDKIIEEAYVKADDILASLKTSCDSILRNFRDKVDIQKKSYTDLRHNLLLFKNELFEKYRLHIELIEKISPMIEDEAMLSPDEYAERIVMEVKREVAAQYGISLDTLTAPEPLKTPEYTAEKPKTARSRKSTKSDGTAKKPAAKKSTRSKKTQKPEQPTVMELIEEYEDPNMLAKSKHVPEEQFMLNFDHPSEAGVLSSDK
jgi:cell division initiation protein